MAGMSRRWTGATLVAVASAVAGCQSRTSTSDDAATAMSEPSADATAAPRRRMVEAQLRARGIVHEATLAAMARVPRHRFVPASLASSAYDDTPLPIGEGQTISQPYIVAYMTEALAPAATDRVLEIGTGSGYQAAVLAEVAAEVYTIELLPTLASGARQVLADLGYTNVRTRTGDGYEGWPDAAPFDKIVVTAAPLEIPQTLLDQLSVGGILVAPVGRGWQTMTIVRKTAEGIALRETIPVRFVPMVKKDG
jgi:protein-L-isoaspartate(D-aspartate) O-methyltransferase